MQTKESEKVNIGIIGSTGFLGRSLTNYLSQKYSVHVYSRREPSDLFENISSWTIGQLHDEKVLQGFLERIEILIHLGQSGKPMESNNNFVYETEANLIPSLQLIEVLKKTKNSIHILFASSGGTVYQENPDRFYLETDPTEPLTSYGINKLSLEYYFNLLTKISSHSCFTLRISNPYGELLSSGRNQGFIGVSLSRILEGKEVLIFDDENMVRDYIHLEDMCSAFEQAIQFRKAGYSTFNIGTGVGTSLREILVIMEKYFKKTIPRTIVKKDSMIKLPRWSVLNIQKAREELNWKPQIELDSGLQKLIESIQ
ncbi:MAG TPA: NAD-dependent epimerase/dehydratase family protein [Leptospiraceae bacterium]|nr:NAD-dependent epimerase/dehydratase family protein [Leptospiraceae bacterium]HMW04639.1 NAD-dependent epimerase/dehydratase family protein [Leptospiraceae bacterium]HMX31640.1 NAD-dependent epimerase/dehydratase family protein [Leptospiraceae bacterium]HMY30475.1 NAD-dependent epimerase/dehydratase family protein [Leptospiraceae bacterium]HMZ67314.1 NAD-dependent epimerase/dehydratase family protein [Leptospiraceae bacterium]